MKNILLFVCAILLTCCKDAPVVNCAGTYKHDGKSQLFTIQSVFTTTSFEVGGGKTSRGGYETWKLNSIDIATGEPINSIDLGNAADRIEYLGTTQGKALFFSYDPDISIHLRNPETLEIEASVKDILYRNSALISGISAQRYKTSLDTAGTHIFTTTNDGYNFLIDPITLTATKCSSEAQSPINLNKVTEVIDELIINDTTKLSFKGSPRMTAQLLASTKSNLYSPEITTFQNISLIKPECIIDITAKRLNKPLITENVIFIISRTRIEDPFNWLVTALYIDHEIVKQIWQREIENTEQILENNKSILHAALIDDKIVLAFNNMILAFNRQDGAQIWRKDFRRNEKD